jgi:hypothetical protein
MLNPCPPAPSAVFLFRAILPTPGAQTDPCRLTPCSICADPPHPRPSAVSLSRAVLPAPGAQTDVPMLNPCPPAPFAPIRGFSFPGHPSHTGGSNGPLQIDPMLNPCPPAPSVTIRGFPFPGCPSHTGGSNGPLQIVPHAQSVTIRGPLELFDKPDSFPYNTAVIPKKTARKHLDGNPNYLYNSYLHAKRKQLEKTIRTQALEERFSCA